MRKIKPDPRYYDTSDDFFQSVIDEINTTPHDVTDILLGIAQKDHDRAKIVHVEADKIGGGPQFDIMSWTAMVDEAFNEMVMRPWFIGLAVPVTATIMGEIHCFEAVVTMERTVTRHGALPLAHPPSGGHMVVGESMPLTGGIVRDQIDQLVPAIRRHVVHQG